MGKKLKIPANQRFEAIKTFQGAFDILSRDVAEYRAAFAEALTEYKTSYKLDDQFYRDTAMVGFLKCVRRSCDSFEETFAMCDSIMSQVNDILNPEELDEDDLEEVEI
jgi:transposase